MLADKYERLPEWIRWIICWPMSLVGAVVLSLFMYATAKSIGAYDFVLRIGHPVVFQGALLILIYGTVPRAKRGIVLGLILLRAITLLFFLVQIVAMLLAYFNVIGGVIDPFEPVNKDWILGLISEIAILAASIGILRDLPHERAGMRCRRSRRTSRLSSDDAACKEPFEAELTTR